MQIQSATLRTNRGRGVLPAANTNFSPSTGRAILNYMVWLNVRRNPYPRVFRGGPEIERLMALPVDELRAMGLTRGQVVPFVLGELLAG